MFSELTFSEVIHLKNKCLSDQVFGCNLASLCQRENGTVPKFVKLCIEHVEEHGKRMLPSVVFHIKQNSSFVSDQNPLGWTSKMAQLVKC